MTPEFRSSAATLIMSLIKADGEIRREEIKAGYDYLDADEAWAPGANAVLGQRNQGNRLADALGSLRFSPEEDRLDLLAALWDVAGDDGEVCEYEMEFVESAAEALDLPMSYVEIVRPAGFAKLLAASTNDTQRAAN